MECLKASHKCPECQEWVRFLCYTWLMLSIWDRKWFSWTEQGQPSALSNERVLRRSSYPTPQGRILPSLSHFSILMMCRYGNAAANDECTLFPESLVSNDLNRALRFCHSMFHGIF
jgi:hypothetical protein